MKAYTKDERVIDLFALEVCYTSYNCNNSYLLLLNGHFMKIKINLLRHTLVLPPSL